MHEAEGLHKRTLAAAGKVDLHVFTNWRSVGKPETETTKATLLLESSFLYCASCLGDPVGSFACVVVDRLNT